MGFIKFRRKVVGNKADFKEQVVVIKGALVATSGAGTPYSLINPLATRLIITKCILDFTTDISATPVELDVGTGANAGGTYNNLIDSKDVGDSPGAAIYDNVDDQGTAGKASQEWGATEYLTVTVTGTPTGLVGNIYIYYRKA